MISVLYAAAPLAFAFFGVLLAERRPMNRVRNVLPSTQTAAYLGNAVAGSTGRPSE